MTIGLFLDSLTLVLVVSFLLSLVVAVVPEPRGDGSARAKEALWRLGLPPIGGLSLVAIALWPAARTALGGGADHCGPGSAQPHLCWLHASPAGGAAHDGAVLAILTLGLALFLWNAWSWAQVKGRLQLLRAATLPERSAEVRRSLEARGLAWPGALHVVDLGVPLCFVTGLRSPELYLSTATLDGIPPEHLMAMVLHEREHVRRGDNVWRMVGQALLLAHLPGLGRRTYERWTFAAEVACDEAAARSLGSRPQVAEALVRYQRLLNERAFPAAVGAAFGAGGTLTRRVGILLDPPAPPLRLARLWPWAALALLTWQTDAVHGVLETLLGWFHH